MMEKVFGPGGILEQCLPGYEPRPDQARMAALVAAALSEAEDASDMLGKARLLAVEAGTGTGKTLAYLIPSALSGRRVVISTNTLTLQDQIISKEIPFIIKHIVPDLSVLCVKGRQNYLCLYKWRQLEADVRSRLFTSDSEGDALLEWLGKTAFGDRAELGWLADNSPLWHSLSTPASQCLGSQCPEYSSCFITRLRQQAAKSRMLIVNHHLFFSDLNLRRFGNAEVLPRYDSVIFDEAHHLEKVASRYFGSSWSTTQTLDLVSDLEKISQQELRDQDAIKLIQTARAVHAQAEHFAALFPPERGRFPLADFIGRTPSWESERQTLTDIMQVLADAIEPHAITAEIFNGLLRRAEELLGTFLAVTDSADSSRVYWYERRERSLQVSSTPIEMTEILRQSLYSEVRCAVFTSATLATGGDFQYFLHRMGLPPETETAAIDSPYDYAAKTLLYIPDKSFPQPQDREYPQRVAGAIRDLLSMSDGRALVLFTSLNAMHNAYQDLAGTLPWPMHLQGSAPKAALLEAFRADTHSVLFAVASFWEGIDVAGESLSCVIIDKLPFEVPSDPVIMAQINQIREQGGNPFNTFQVPRAILTLRQGFGRLLRSGSDSGVVAILDTRLFSKSYGKMFMKCLPPSPLTRELADVQTFFCRTSGMASLKAGNSTNKNTL
jgi:ATP-dependent DNA helicase DinG